MDKKLIARGLVCATLLMLIAEENEASWLRELSQRRVISERVRSVVELGDILVRVTAERFHYGLVVAPPQESMIEILQEDGSLTVYDDDERFRPKVHDRIEFLTPAWCERFMEMFGGDSNDIRCKKLATENPALK